MLLSRADFLLVFSLALFAASLARDAVIALSIIILATAGFSSINSVSFSFTIFSTIVLISLFPSFVFV